MIFERMIVQINPWGSPPGNGSHEIKFTVTGAGGEHEFTEIMGEDFIRSHFDMIFERMKHKMLAKLLMKG